MLRHIQHLGVGLQRTVSLVGARLITVLEGKALPTVALHFQHLCLAGKCGQFRAVAIHGHYLQLIVGGSLQAHQVGAPVGAVVAHQFTVYLGVVGILSAFHIDIVIADVAIQAELDVGSLQPALSLQDAHLVGNRLGKGDGGHRVVVLVLTGHDLAVVESHLVDVCRVIVFRRAVREFQLHLVLGGVLLDVVLCLCARGRHQGEQGDE